MVLTIPVKKEYKGAIVDERQWIHAIRKGNKEPLGDIAEKYYDDIWRFCAFQTGSREDAYDLAQETFVRFIRYVESYHDRNLKGYLLTIARNVCRDYLRRKHRETTYMWYGDGCPPEEGQYIRHGRGRDCGTEEGGYDRLKAGNGYIRMKTEGGYDRLKAGNGYIRMETEDGYDRLKAGNDYIRMETEDGYDRLKAENGHTCMETEGGYDRLKAGNGHTCMETEDGYDRLKAGNGYAHVETESGYASPEAKSGDCGGREREEGYRKAPEPTAKVPGQRAYGDPERLVYANPERHMYGNPEQHAYGNPEQHAYGNPEQHAYRKSEQHAYRKSEQHVYGNPEQYVYDSPEQHAVDADIHDRLMQALAQLPQMQREAILLHYLYDMKYREIGRVTDAQVSTVKSRVRQGMEKLQGILRREDFLD